MNRIADSTHWPYENDRPVVPLRELGCLKYIVKIVQPDTILLTIKPRVYYHCSQCHS